MAGEDLLALAEAQGRPGQGTSAAIAEGGDPIAVRVRNWILTDLQSEFWKTYIRQSDIDAGYYVGGELQWVDDDGNKDDLELLKREKRAHVSVNQIKPIVKVLTGLERQTRFDLKVLPQGEEDDEDARVMSWLMKWQQQQAHIPERRSIAFKRATIRGMAVLTCEIDWTQDPVHGDIITRVLRPGKNCIWDRHAEELDFSDAAHFVAFEWAWVEDVVAKFPDKEGKIRAALTYLNDILAAAAPVAPTSKVPGDAYGSVGEHPIEVDALNPLRSFYDPVLQRLLVAEAWYPEYETRYWVHDTRTGGLTEADTREAAQKLVDSDKEHLALVRRLVKQMKVATVLPATLTELEDGDSAYENDAEHYPFVLELAERVDDDVRGIVRDLRDPQRVENKRISQALDLVARWSKIRRTYVEGSVSPAVAKSLDDPLSEVAIPYKPGMDKPGWDIPQGLPELARLLAALADQMKISIREISGVNTDLLGLRGDTASGIAIARRQAQGQVIATELFDNHRWAGEYLGQRLGRRIQQKFTRDEYVRLTNDVEAPVLVHLNPFELKNLPKDARKSKRLELAQMGKPPILADVEKFKYDLSMAEAPASPTARAEARDTLLQMIERVPAFLPILADKIIKLSDGIPDRHEIIQRLAAMQGGGVPTGPGQTPAPAMPTAGVQGVPNTQGENPTTVAPAPPPAAA